MFGGDDQANPVQRQGPFLHPHWPLLQAATSLWQKSTLRPSISQHSQALAPPPQLISVHCEVPQCQGGAPKGDQLSVTFWHECDPDGWNHYDVCEQMHAAPHGHSHVPHTFLCTHDRWRALNGIRHDWVCLPALPSYKSRQQKQPCVPLCSSIHCHQPLGYPCSNKVASPNTPHTRNPLQRFPRCLLLHPQTFYSLRPAAAPCTNCTRYSSSLWIVHNLHNCNATALSPPHPPTKHPTTKICRPP